MMTGYVRSKGLGLRGNQVSKSLRRVNPVNHSRRREDTVRRQNPVPYYAPYFGNKLHCDQNEKLAMYGCTFFAMSDGCSSKIVKLFSMPRNARNEKRHPRNKTVNMITRSVLIDLKEKNTSLLFVVDRRRIWYIFFRRVKWFDFSYRTFF